MKTRAATSMGMCAAPRALETRREDANRSTAAPGSSREGARAPLGNIASAVECSLSLPVWTYDSPSGPPYGSDRAADGL
jgi:hypothetical protein